MKKLIIAMLFLLFSTNNTHSMQRLATKLNQVSLKFIAKKGFSGLMTGLHWGIAAAMPIGMGIKAIRDTISEDAIVSHFPKPTDEVTTFIESKLTTPVKGIKASPYLGDNGDNFAASNKYILLSFSTHNKIYDALKNNDQKTLDIMSSILPHEESHIKNKDITSRTIVELTTPFFTHALIKKIYNASPYKSSINSFALQQLVKIPSGLGKCAISLYLIAAFDRYLEQRADDQTPNNLQSLTNLKEYFKIMQKDQVEIVKKRQSTMPSIIQKLDDLDRKYFAPHPSTESRIAKVDQRIEKLEKSQTQLAKEDSA